MILKLALLGSILIVGSIFFTSQIQEIFPNTSSDGVNSLKSDVSSLTTSSIDIVEEKIEISVKKTENKISEFGHIAVNKAENTIESSVKEAENKFSEIQQNSKEYFEKNITKKISAANSNQ